MALDLVQQLEKVLRQMIAASSGFYITAAEVAVILQNEMRKVVPFRRRWISPGPWDIRRK
ncbi:hypothetical protein [Dysosmobacter welbionis]|uniref:hypothetical protein n=1 Tax=Dysosmobacter welbionis TaxID=2093857 RepID=UPI0023526E14|nr:hypothetical protein [Dysosmobacter welbionis]